MRKRESVFLQSSSLCGKFRKSWFFLFLSLLLAGNSIFAQTVTFLVPAQAPETGWTTYLQVTADSEGHLAYEPSAPNPGYYGMLSFIGWYLSEDANINDLSQRFVFDPTTVYTTNTTYYAIFGSNYVVQFLDGYGKVVYSELVVAGGHAMPPGSSQLPDMNDFMPEDKVFENKWAYSATPFNGAFNFELTEINQNMTLVPILYDAVTIYFETYGTFVAPIRAKKGEAIGTISPFPDPLSIDRRGYSPMHWSLVSGDSGAGDAFNSDNEDVSPDKLDPNYILNENVHLYLHWVPIENAATYRVIYWVEKANLGINFTPQPGNPDHYVFGYAETAHRICTPDQTVGGPGSGADIIFDTNDMPDINIFNIDDPMRYAEWQYTEFTTVILTEIEEEVSIVNVYCKRKVFSILFNLGNANKTMDFDSDHDGITEHYTNPTGVPDPNPYRMYMKFEDDIASRWPHPTSGATFADGRADYANYTIFNYWNPTAVKNLAQPTVNMWTTPRIVANASMMLNIASMLADITEYTLTLAVTNIATRHMYVRYYAEVQTPEPSWEAILPHRYYTDAYGTTKYFVLMPEYNAEVWTGGAGMAAKTIPGMETVVWADDFSDGEDYNYEGYYTSTPPEGVYRNFYYIRNIYTLTYDFMGHTPENQPYTEIQLCYKAPLNDHDIVPEPVPGYVFKGWYADAKCTLPFNFNSTVPAQNLAVYAEWESLDNTITFVESDGTALANDGSDKQGVADGFTVNLNNLTIGGIVYTPGYNDPERGSFLGWDYFPDEFSLKAPFPVNMKIYQDWKLYARWQTDGLTITYFNSDGSTILTVDNAAGSGYELGAQAQVRDVGGVTVPSGKQMLGWRVDGMGVVYQAYSSIPVTGNLRLYPYIATLTESLIHLTYKSNYSGSTVPDHVVDLANGGNLKLATAVEVPSFVRPQYTLAGWNTKADGLGDHYDLGQMFSMPFSDYTLYAEWEVAQYSIKYVADWDTAAIGNPLHYTVLANDVQLNPPGKKGYTFNGWNIQSDSASVAPLNNVTALPAGIYGNLTVTPQWNIINYTIDYLNCTNVLNPTTYNVTTPYFSLKPPVEPGKTFVGWTGTDISGVQPRMTVAIPKGSVGDREYTAHWGFQFDEDTIYACTPPIILESGNDATSYEWLLPNGHSLRTPSIHASLSGQYVLKSNYGTQSIVTMDTIVVLFPFETTDGIITTAHNSTGQSNSFSVNVNPAFTDVTYKWTFPDGTQATSSSPSFTFDSDGQHVISVEVTVRKGAFECSRTLTHNLTLQTTPPTTTTSSNRGLFVDQNVAGGAHDGSSWADAFTTIDEALAIAGSGDYIWVAKGDYSSTTGGAYSIKSGVAIFGGFNATETNLSERNFAANPTIMRGVGTSVVTFVNANSNTRIDGFIIEGGTSASGAGIDMKNSSPVIANCIIRGNTATDKGGGINMDGGSPILYNVEISGNTAAKGAGIFADNATPQLTNVTIAGNLASQTGGGMYNSNANPVIRNSIVWGNRAGANPNVANVASNPDFASSIVEGSGGSSSWNSDFGVNTSNNLDINPGFVRNGFDLQGNRQTGDYKLKSAGGAVDRGNNSYLNNSLTLWDVNLQNPSNVGVYAVVPFDLAYRQRIENSVVDLGAYEADSPTIDVYLVRQVIMPSVEGVTTSPVAGVYYVLSSHDFTFTVHPKEGFSIAQMHIATNIPQRDEDGIVTVYNADGTASVTIMSITEPIMVDITNVIRTTGNEAIVSDRVWAFDATLHIETEAPSEVRIYNMSGQLHKIERASAGHTAIKLPAGFYAVALNGRVYKIIAK